MGCGRSKSSVESVSPTEDRRQLQGDDEALLDADGSRKDTIEAVSYCDNSQIRNSFLNQTKAVSSSQLDFFRELDEKIGQGKELAPEILERENQRRMRGLLRQWEDIVRSRPCTSRRISSSSRHTLTRSPSGGATVSGASDDSGGRLERNARSSRRSVRSACQDRDPSPAVSSAEPDGGALVSRLVQLGDAYVRDLDADDPDSFVRLGRRPSTYEEVAIPEESALAPGKELAPDILERENQRRMRGLLRQWEDIVRSRPCTSRRISSSSRHTLTRSPSGGATVSGASDDSGGRLERNARSSRRSVRSACQDRDPSPAVSSAEPDGGALVSRLVQLGDAYVRDLDADDPDSFVRLGRRPSTYEEVAIPEESALASVR